MCLRQDEFPSVLLLVWFSSIVTYRVPFLTGLSLSHRQSLCLLSRKIKKIRKGDGVHLRIFCCCGGIQGAWEERWPSGEIQTVMVVQRVYLLGGSGDQDLCLRSANARWILQMQAPQGKFSRPFFSPARTAARSLQLHRRGAVNTKIYIKKEKKIEPSILIITTTVFFYYYQGNCCYTEENPLYFC